MDAYCAHPWQRRKKSRVHVSIPKIRLTLNGHPHSDWINRYLGFTNNEFLDDSILADYGLSFEAYQDTFKLHSDIYIIDVTTSPERLRDALASKGNHVDMLAHERRWPPGPVVNTVANLDRALEAVCCHLKSKSCFPH